METELKQSSMGKESIDPPLANPPNDAVSANPQDSKPLALVQKVVKKPSGGSLDRDIALAEVEKDKRFSYIKAWEESEKTKAENKAQKKLSSVTAWENSKKAALEAKLKKREEEMEKKKAEYGETVKNKVAAVHKLAEEKRAGAHAIKSEELIKVEEVAAKHRATGTTPKKFLGVF